MFGAGQATDENMANEYCMLDIKGYKQTFRKCNNYCISTATMDPLTHLNVKLYILTVRACCYM